MIILNKYWKAINLLISKKQLILIAIPASITTLFYRSIVRNPESNCKYSNRWKLNFLWRLVYCILSFAQKSGVRTLLFLLYSSSHKTSIVIITATLASWSSTLDLKAKSKILSIIGYLLTDLGRLIFLNSENLKTYAITIKTPKVKCLISPGGIGGGHQLL